MKVTFVSTYPPANCGIAVYSQYLVEALRKLCMVDVLPVIAAKANPLYFIGLALKARKGADVVHVQYDCSFFGTISVGALSLSGMYTPLFYLLVRCMGGPAIVTTLHELQDVETKYCGRWLYLPMHLYYRAIYGAMVKLSDVIIVHTRDSIDRLSQYVRPDNAEIVPLACYVRPVNLPPDECKARLGLAGRTVVTAFGFVSPPKGHKLTIEAMDGLPGDIVLLIAGDGRTAEDAEYVRSLKELVKEKGLESRVLFCGYVPDEELPVVMGASDLIVMPYDHVVQSAALSVALAYRKPVVASDIGGFREVARERQCIATFAPGDVEGLRSRMRAVFTDAALRHALKENASVYARSTSIESIASRTAEVYLEALAMRHQRRRNGRS